MFSDSGLIETGYSCLVVRSFDEEPLSADVPSDNTLVAAGELGDLLVTTADQWGPFEVTTRLWEAPPADPGPEWEDVVELDLTTPAALAVTELVENDPLIDLVADPGEYRIRVSARGRRIPDHGGDDELDDLERPPVEWYLVEAWPAAPAGPRVVRLDSPFAEHQLNPPPPLVIPEGGAGLAASVRIGRDVDGLEGARSLSGEVGSARAERRIRGTRRRLFRWCAHVTSWSHLWVEGSSWSWMGIGPYDDEYAPGHPHWAFSGDHADQLTGRNGAVRYSFLDVDKPGRAVRVWEWMVTPERDRVLMDRMAPLLREPTRVTVTLTQSRDAERDAWTTIAIDHSNVPVEWVEDLETYWDYQLAIAEHARFGLPK